MESSYGLVLSRKQGESVIIAHPLGPIEVILVEPRHNGTARIGFKAHPDIAVHRKEVWDEIRRRENSPRLGAG